MRMAAMAVAALGIALAAGADAADPDTQTRATMDEIFDALRIALPLSLDDDRFGDPAERERILAALTKLADNGARLEAHGSGRDAGFSHLSHSLARDTRDIQRRYEAGKIPEARFLLHELTSTCVACHSRLPYDRTFPLGEDFVEGTVVAALPLEERARYEMATRQFDRALATHEELFAAPGASPTDLSLMGHFDDYLEVCLRVRQDPARARRTLETFARRTDLSQSVRANVESWIASLVFLEGREPATDLLAEANALLAKAGDRRRFPDDRRALVLFIAASGALHRYVAADTPTPERRAEAYYRLGVVESRIGRSLWLSQAEVFLEAAIRTAPGAETAPEAFALLEDVILSGWTGSGGARVPPDVDARLAGLLQLIHDAKESEDLPARSENSLEPRAEP